MLIATTGDDIEDTTNELSETQAFLSNLAASYRRCGFGGWWVSATELEDWRRTAMMLPHAFCSAERALMWFLNRPIYKGGP